MTSDPPVAIPCVDWNTISEEILCPLCDYNLRGLIEPRCPECGYRFEWRGLLDPKYRLHPYLFEHHPDRNVRSFLRTALGGWRPRRFWRLLLPVHRLRPKRMIQYWCICASFLLLSEAVRIGAMTYQAIRANNVGRAWLRGYLAIPQSADYARDIRQRYGSVTAYLGVRYPTNPLRALNTVMRSEEYRDEALFLAVVPLAWPWITFASLLIFQASMRRERIKSVHVLRCVVYSSDVLAWLGLGLPLAIVLQVFLTSALRGSILGAIGVIELFALGLILTAALVMAYRLAVAYRWYMTFDRPIMTIVASQMITLLLSLNLFWAPLLWR